MERTANVTAFPTDPAGGTVVTMGDDNFVEVALTGGTTVSHYGVSYPSFFIGSNGYITFGVGDTARATSRSRHFLYPRITALFTNLVPNRVGAVVSWQQLADRVAVTFQNVMKLGSTTPNNFQFEMFLDGHIRITCLGIAVTDGLIGLSHGPGGLPGDFIESSFSDYPVAGYIPPRLVLTMPNNVSESAGVLAGLGTISLLTPIAEELLRSLG